MANVLYHQHSCFVLCNNCHSDKLIVTSERYNIIITCSNLYCCDLYSVPTLNMVWINFLQLCIGVHAIYISYYTSFCAIRENTARVWDVFHESEG